MLLKKLSSFFLDILEVFVFAIAIFLFVYLLVMQPHKIKGASMEPNFPDGEYLLTDKLSYRFREPERGDVVVFEAPRTDEEEFIKRIIGLPGERITVKNGHVFVDGQELNENYLDPTLITSPGSFLTSEKEVVVPDNNFFVLGDNRPASSDSRMWGFVSKDKITGRAFVIYWPPPEVGLVQAAEYNIK